MASATVESPSDRLQLESIATVDLHLLSQSELYALSLCSDGAFDPRRCDEVVIPKIDRSVFNESAGSRKQTYSRLRLAPRKPESSAPTVHRTPHLRTPKSDDNDHERAENSQIIGLLQQLFSSEASGDDLVPIPVEYTNSVPQYPNSGHNVQKRKRGRPRKDENLAVVVSEAVEVVPVEAVVEGGDNVFKDIVVYENVEDRDKETVNIIGNVVDLVALASLEDPYGPELQRRTGALKTEEELLGFLRGLNGQWGSRRKKKKIVDASEFGDALPKGWKISLSLKRKDGHLWLYVRQYISPNGRQFISCKDISLYLLSLGLQDVNLPNCAQSSENTQLAHNAACGNSADLAVKEINKTGDLDCYSPSVITCVSNDHVKQVTSVVGNSQEIQRGEILKCDKCSTTFDVKDDLLHHQLLCRRRKRSRFATSITDGVIIKGGQYECQFCHKTFNEKNRYNGHVGAHKRHHMKSEEASPGVLSMQISFGPVSSDGVPPKDSVMQTFFGDDYKALNFDANAGNDLNYVSPQSKLKSSSVADSSSNEVNCLSQDEQYARSNKNEMEGAEESCVKHEENCKTNKMVDDTTDVVAKYDFFLDSKALCGNETNINGEANGSESSDRVNYCPVGQGRCVESSPNSPLAFEKTCGAEIDVNRGSVSVEEPNQEAGLEIFCGVEKEEDMHFTSQPERFKLDVEKFDNKSIHGICSRARPDEDLVSEGKQQNGSGGCLLIPVTNDKKCGNFNKVNAVSTSTVAESKRERGSESIDNEICGAKYNLDAVSVSTVPKPQLDDIYNSGIKEVSIGWGSCYCREGEDAVVRVEEENSESYLLNKSWKEPLHDIQDNGRTYSGSVMEEFGREEGSERGMLIQSGYEQNLGIKIDFGNVSTRKMEEPKLDELQRYDNNKLTFDMSNDGLNAQQRSFDFCSLALSANERTHNAEENLLRIYNSTEEAPKQERSLDTGSPNQSCLGRIFGDVYDINSVYTSSIEEPKPHEVPNSSNGELILPFGNDGSGVVADVISRVPIEQTISVENNLSRKINSIGKDQKQESGSLGLSCYPRTCGNGNNLNRVEAGRFWVGPMIDEVEISGHDKLTIAFGSSNAQPEGDVLPGSMWGTCRDNVLRGTLADNSTQQEQSCFPTFNTFSDKAEHEFFNIDRKYDSMSGFEGTQSGRTEHVEYSFMTTENLDPLSGGSKALSYDAQNQNHGFDSSFWLGKDALSLNIAARNYVTTVCVWCRNEFHHEPVHSGTQTGAIGSICPTCSAKVSAQFNFF